METGLSGRVALVTGASRGIGRATARAFAAEGARVAITFRDDEAGAAGLVKQLQAGGIEAMAARLELQAPETVTRAVDAVLQRWERIDVLVANAVQWPTTRPEQGRFENIAYGEWRELLQANVEGTAATVRAVLPGMRDAGWGRIVLVSSGVGDEGVPGPSPYGPAKSAFRGLARTLAWDAGRDGILVNVVNAGFTTTERNRERWPDATREQIAARTPSGRLSSPADVAALIVFLGSAANANITGEIVAEGSSTGRSAHVMRPAAT